MSEFLTGVFELPHITKVWVLSNGDVHTYPVANSKVVTRAEFEKAVETPETIEVKKTKKTK
jgi:hypothetical protein